MEKLQYCCTCERNEYNRIDGNRTEDSCQLASSQHENDKTYRVMRLNDSIESSKSGDLATFYSGSQVANTMDKIRRTIQYVRRHWYNDRERFNESLKNFLTEELSANHSKVADIWEKHLRANIDWCDLGAKDAGEHWVIRLYTTQESYNHVFRPIYRMLRHQDNASDEEVLRAVYLIELVNIDLYNYVMRNPKADNFQGCVYRGMVLEQKHIDQYRSLMKQSINDRYIAIPLALNSASMNIKISERFIHQQMKKEDKLAAQLIVHVIGLPNQMLENYQKRFPESKVSSICAVDISPLSAYPEESEILLRGAFLQVLSVTDCCLDDVPIVKIECMMLNANRDHLNNGVLHPEIDASARQLFGLMVRSVRYKYCARYCTDRGLTADAEEYQTAYEDNQQLLDQLMDMNTTDFSS